VNSFGSVRLEAYVLFSFRDMISLWPSYHILEITSGHCYCSRAHILFPGACRIPSADPTDDKMSDTLNERDLSRAPGSK